MSDLKPAILESYEKLLKKVYNVNVRGKKFNIKWIKNVRAFEKLYNELKKDLEPDREFQLYLEQYENAKGNEKITIKQRFKKAIQRYNLKLKMVEQKYSNYPIELEEFTIKELPSSIDTKTIKLLDDLGLILWEEDNGNKDKN